MSTWTKSQNVRRIKNRILKRLEAFHFLKLNLFWLCLIWQEIIKIIYKLSNRGWSPKFETGINIIIKSALYSIFWQDSITNIKINSFQIFWRLCDPFYWEYTKDLLGVYFGYTGGIFGLYLSYSGAILELYWGYLILGV